MRYSRNSLVGCVPEVVPDDRRLVMVRFLEFWFLFAGVSEVSDAVGMARGSLKVRVQEALWLLSGAVGT